jgi:hypothetical protein
MKNLMTVLALGAAMTLGAVSGAKAAAADKPLKGKITSIKPDDDKKSMDFVVVKGKNKDEITFVADDSATVTVDGATAKLADLTVGEYVTVTPASGKPTSIVALTKRQKKTPAATTAPAADAK